MQRIIPTCRVTVTGIRKSLFDPWHLSILMPSGLRSRAKVELISPHRFRGAETDALNKNHHGIHGLRLCFLRGPS